MEATFIQEQYTLTLGDDGNGTVSATPSQSTYTFGQTVTLTPLPEAGYSFDSWSGDLGGSANPGTVVITGNTTVNASFSQDHYLLTVTMTGDGSVSVTPDQPDYLYGESVTLTAAPDPGYTFGEWTGDVASGDNPVTIPITGHTTVQANFNQEQYTLSVTASGSGSVSVTPDQPVYVYGDVVTLTAVPVTGYSFTGWSGDLTGTVNPSDIVMDGNKSVTASFALNTYSLTPSAGANGSISPSTEQIVNHGGSQVFTITPAPGYHVEDILVDGVSEGAASSYTFSNVTEDHTIHATFAINTYTIASTAGPNGSISPAGSIIVEHGEDRTFTILPDEGYHILDVLVDGVSQGTVSTVTLTDISDDHVITATFEINSYAISVIQPGDGVITPAGTTLVEHGSGLTYTFTPDEGYHVASIEVDGATLPPQDSYTFSNVVQDHTLTAVFEINTYTLTPVAGANGTINPGTPQVVDHGSSMTFTITPDEGYHIVDVQLDGSSVGNVNSYTFNGVDRDHTLAATFAINTYTVTPFAGNHGSIAPSTVQTVDHGDDLTFVITPDEGYHIGAVLVDGTSAGAPSSYTFNDVTENHTIEASFVINTYTLSPEAGANGSIAPAIDQIVSYGGNATFTVTPDEGYHILDVLVDGVSVGPVGAYTFTGVDADHTIEARFEINTYALEPAAGPNGSISPSTVQQVTHGGSQTFEMLPDEGYHVENVRVDGVSMGAMNSYTFSNVTSDHTIQVTFAINTYSLVPSAGPNGSITPGLTQLVEHGSSHTFTFTPDPGYHVDEVMVDGTDIGAVSSYTFNNVTRSHTIEVRFDINSYTLTPMAGPNGSISPSLPQTVDHGETLTFTITPDAGYHIGEVRVDGTSVGPVSNFIFSDVSADHTIEATFEINTYTITPVAGPDGTITPSSPQTVDHGGSLGFAIIPDEGYHIADVRVDGTSVGSVENFTFTGVSAHHTLSATFEINTYTITPGAGPHGTVNPGIETEVEHGGELTFSVVPDEGYAIDMVVVDGINRGAIESYTFTNVTGPHELNATFRKVVGITEVSIPNGTMKIGDVVSATLEVTYDNFIPYRLLSGNVGGYALTGLQRINATTYLANFVITEGGNSYRADQDIPVSDLVITDGTVQSDPYSAFIGQDNDLLDAEYPSITGMTVASGVNRIGSVVELIITADGEGYTMLPASSVNGIGLSDDRVSFVDLGGGTYQLLYTVREGDNDVSPGELQASVIMVKPSGNIGAPYNQVANTENLVIDAHPPVITRMEVTNRSYGVGQTVRVAITADGNGYAAMDGTMINGIPLTSPRVSFTERSAGLYELSYLIQDSDNDVAPGELDAVLVVSDPAGNNSEPFGILAANSLEVYTDLPTVTMAGIPEICDGDLASLTVYFQGRGPWGFELYDGIRTTSFNDIDAEEYALTVEPVQTTTYSITSVQDVNGVTNIGSGSVQVEVHEKTDVEIVNLAAGYSVAEDPVQLLANIPGGIFTGPGIISPSGLFDPAIADTVNSPHTILYTYTNQAGCTSVATARVFVLGSMGGIFIPSAFVCDNGEPFEVSASNIAGETGTFKLRNENDQVVAGLTDEGNNTAIINPGILKEGSYTIEYSYFDGVVHQIRKQFVLESVDTPEILNLTGDSYCQNVDPFLLEADAGEALFSGPGVYAASGGYLFDPSGVRPGKITIYCENVSAHGCSERVEKALEILAAPQTGFTLGTHCIPAEGGAVEFDNLTPEKLNIASWQWDFGDPASGDLNQSDRVNPVHFYDQPGSRNITLTATTYEGCSEKAEVETHIGTIPRADFTWVSSCYQPDLATAFLDRSEAHSETVRSFLWKFQDLEGRVLDSTRSFSSLDTVWYQFDGDGGFNVELIPVSDYGCTDSITRTIYLQPTILLTDEGYHETFDQDNGLWEVRSEGGPVSWVLSEPDFSGFDAVQGDLAWHTRFPAGVAGYLESSWVESPCYDFSDVERGMIQLHIMRSFVPGLNGAVLQYRDVLEEGWKNVGANDSGIGWYNMPGLINQPGGSQTGWGLEVFNPDRDWVRAAHALDQLDGKSGISFRIAVASTGAQGIGNQGFAFDDVFIGERNRISLLEHFTSASTESSRLADDLIDSLSAMQQGELINIQYHTAFPGEDPMNENNPYPASTRTFYYGIQQVPYAVLDGGVQEQLRHDFPDLLTIPLKKEAAAAPLEIPPFRISLQVDWSDSGLESTATVTCDRGPCQENIQLYLVVIEREVTLYRGVNGDTLFRNVVLDMLPDPMGSLLGADWEKGDQESRTYSWNYQSYVEDISELGVVAFIQERSSGKILQAAVSYRDWGVDVETVPEIQPLQVYPNPVKDQLFVNLGRSPEIKGELRIVDMNGREMMAVQVPPGYQIHSLDVGELNRGLYILYWFEGEQFRGLSKVVKTE